MSLDNANNFVKESSIHIANINRALKNIKSDVMADFIWVENNSIVISTNKVANLLMSKLKAVDFIYSSFLFYFHSPFDLCSFFIFRT